MPWLGGYREERGAQRGTGGQQLQEAPGARLAGTRPADRALRGLLWHPAPQCLLDVIVLQMRRHRYHQNDNNALLENASLF